MIWKVKEKTSKDFLDKFPELSTVAAQLLWNRDLKEQKDIDEFLNPDYENDLHDPFLFRDMEKAVERIGKAIDSKEKIIINGDYDVDGMTAATILKEVIGELGGKVDVFIPSRYKDGYGLNIDNIKRFKEEGYTLLVTCDCGISSKDAIDRANEIGLDVVISDHHSIPEDIPEALAIVHPAIEGGKYPFADLAGAGVAFKLACALLRKLGKDVPEGREKWLLDLVAMGTVADCSSLLGENRTLVKYGLVVLQKTKRMGLQKMLEKIKRKGEDLSSYDIGYRIGPRINAPGRLGSPQLSFDLLNVEKEDDAVELAWRLDQSNVERGRETQQIMKGIEKDIEKDIDKTKLIFAVGDDWKEGVLGLVAGRLMDKYTRPVIMLRKYEDEGIAKGSVRSTEDFHAAERLREVKDVLEAQGGHARAAGLTVSLDKLEEFEKRIKELADKDIDLEDVQSVIEIEAELKGEDVNWEVQGMIDKLQPFGAENEVPFFLLKDAVIREMRGVGADEKHLKMKLELKAGKLVDCIGFNLGERMDEIEEGDTVDVVFEMDVNEWNGNREIQFKLQDFKKK